MFEENILLPLINTIARFADRNSFCINWHFYTYKDFAKHIGGLSRAATILNELAEEIRFEKINEHLAQFAETATLQRLGYIADQILHKKELADAIENLCKRMNLKFFRVSLMIKGNRYGYACNERWKVIENSQIEIDE